MTSGVVDVSKYQAGVLEDVSNVYLGGRLCAARQPKNVIEPQDLGGYYYRHCFASRRELFYIIFRKSAGFVPFLGKALQ